MKCPYCSNETTLEGVRCSICGANLEHSIKKRKDYKILGLTSIIIGTLFMILSIFWFIAVRANNVIFGNNPSQTVKASAPSTVSILIFGILFIAIGVYAVVKSSKTNTVSEGNPALAFMFSYVFGSFFLILTIISFGTTYSVLSKSGMFGNFGLFVLIPIIFVPAIVFISLLVSIFKEMRK